MSEANQEPSLSGMSANQKKLAHKLVLSINSKAILGCGYPAGFAGIVYRCGGLPPVALYDIEECALAMSREDDMDPCEALDAFNYSALRCIGYEGENSEAYINMGYEVYEDDGAVLIPEFEVALLGPVMHSENTLGVAGYDMKRCIKILMQGKKLKKKEAQARLEEIMSSGDPENGPTFIELVDGWSKG